MKRFLMLLVAAAMLLTACGPSNTANVNDLDIDLSSYPVESDITLTYFRDLSANVSTLVDNFAETHFAKEYEKRTGIKIEYQHPVAGQATEAVNLMIASNDLSDIVENNWVTAYPGGPTKAIADGVIIDIKPYKEYAPALFKIFEENPEYDKASKTNDGEYYGFPLIMGDPRLCIMMGPVVRKDWLDELGMQEPETLEDWDVMLTAFKEKKGATAPFSINFGSLGKFFSLLGASKGQYIKDNKVVFGPVQPEFKEALAVAADWYNKGILDKNVASVDNKMLGSQILSGQTGAAVMAGGSGLGVYQPAGVLENPKFELTGVKYPTKEKGGVNKWASVNHPITGSGTAAITTQCKHPALAAKALDYLYTEEGHILGNFGIEGETYTMVDGAAKYTDLIMNNPDGLNVSQALGMYVRAGSGTAFVCNPGYIDQYYALPQQQKALDAWVPSVEPAWEIILPPITPSSEATEEYANIMNEVQKQVDQMVIKFIMGIEPLDKYDEFVATLNQLGLERAMEIQTEALKAYNNR